MDKYQRKRPEGRIDLQKTNCRDTKDKRITVQKSFCKAFDKSNVVFGNLQHSG